MKVKGKSEKAVLKLNIQKMKTMVFGPITSWQIEGKTMETLTDFIFFWGVDSKITEDGDCSHKIKRLLLNGRKAMTNIVSVLKSRNIAFLTNVCTLKAMVFTIVMYECENWIINMTESQRIDVFELWCWKRLLRVPWTARRSNQSTLKKSTLNINWKDWCWSWSYNILAT